MLRRIVTKRRLGDGHTDRAYWLSRPPAERIGQVQNLRVEYYGWADEAGPRLQRVHRVLRQA
jgi:hypothetical protein